MHYCGDKHEFSPLLGSCFNSLWAFTFIKRVWFRKLITMGEMSKQLILAKSLAQMFCICWYYNCWWNYWRPKFYTLLAKQIMLLKLGCLPWVFCISLSGVNAWEPAKLCTFISFLTIHATVLSSWLRLDKETETGIMATIHGFLRNGQGNEEIVQYGLSTSNKEVCQ